MPNISISINFVYGLGFFILGHICAWFQLNSQFAWEWWEDKPLLAVGIYSIPVGLSFFLNETMFTTKTMVCIGLSFCIMGVQLFWR